MGMRAFPPLLLIALAAACLLCACGGSDISPETPRSRLEFHRALWQGQSLRAYRFRVRVSCFCPPEATAPTEFTVRDGVATPVRETMRRFETIEKLFAFIEEEIARGAQMVDVTYDPARGYPTQIVIDGSPQIADDELGVQVDALTPLAP